MTTIRCAHGRTISLDRPRLMAIVNVTPDSFSDGGRYAEVEAAVTHAVRCLEEGATILDVGGESTRPGAARIGADEQLRRVLPVVERLAERGEVESGAALISVDTTLASVAEAALRAGAHLINDVSAGREDSEMLPLAAERGAGLILMHRLRPPDADRFSHEYQEPPRYDDVVGTVRKFLLDRAAAAMEHGVHPDSIVIDPGLGFGKTVAQNFELIRRVGELAATGHPVLGAASRKSFLGHVGGVTEPAWRIAGSVAAAVAMYERGVRLFRVHDVAPHREALAVAAALA